MSFLSQLLVKLRQEFLDIFFSSAALRSSLTLGQLDAGLSPEFFQQPCQVPGRWCLMTTSMI